MCNKNVVKMSIKDNDRFKQKYMKLFWHMKNRHFIKMCQKNYTEHKKSGLAIFCGPR